MTTVEGASASVQHLSCAPACVPLAVAVTTVARERTKAKDVWVDKANFGGGSVKFREGQRLYVLLTEASVQFQ